MGLALTIYRREDQARRGGSLCSRSWGQLKAELGRSTGGPTPLPCFSQLWAFAFHRGVLIAGPMCVIAPNPVGRK